MDDVDRKTGLSHEYQILDEIDQTITSRYILAKFVGPVILHGNEILPAGFNSERDGEYVIAPRDKPESSLEKIIDPTNQFSALNTLIRDAVYDSNGYLVADFQRNLAKCHTLAYYKDGLGTKISHLMLLYPYSFLDSKGRPALTARIFFELPTESMSKLLALIRENPDLLEMFYKTSASGLEDSVKRVESDTVAIVDLEKFMPIQRFSSGKYWYSSVGSHKDLLDQDVIELLRYRQPHGEVKK